MSSLPARMRLIKLKMKEIECSQDFSHYKYMGIFTDPQGQVTPQSSVQSGQISNSSEMLRISSLPASMKKILLASMKKIRSKIEALECSQHYTSIFQMCKGRKLRSPWSDLAKFRPPPRCYRCSRYLQV